MKNMKTQFERLVLASLILFSGCSSLKTSGEKVRTEHLITHGTRYAYRKFGKVYGYPLVLFQHFRGSMDNWDPALIDALAKERTVVVFDNKGVSGTDGTTPESFAAMADDAANFIGALGFPKVDILGFSIGGAVAQEVAIRHPELIRRVILAATAPQGSGGINKRSPEILALATKAQPEPEDFLVLFFEPSDSSQKLGREFLARLKERKKDDLDQPSSEQTMKAQLKARNDWGSHKDPDFAELKRITQPVLVANGSHDIMMGTSNSITLYQNLPNAELILYPDSGHGFLFQYPKLFARQASAFLNADDKPSP